MNSRFIVALGTVFALGLAIGAGAGYKAKPQYMSHLDAVMSIQANNGAADWQRGWDRCEATYKIQHTTNGIICGTCDLTHYGQLDYEFREKYGLSLQIWGATLGKEKFARFYDGSSWWVMARTRSTNRYEFPEAYLNLTTNSWWSRLEYYAPEK